MKKHIRIIVIVIAAAVFMVSAYQIFANLSEKKEAENIYESIASQAVTVITPQNENSSDTQDVNTPPITVNFEQLKQTNSDIVGWIYCADTPINYPIVKIDDSDDYDYYLAHTFDGKKNSSGSIFTDCRNTGLFNDYNNILYGHSMKNGTMFAYMLRYTNQEFYNSHKYMWLFTENETYRIDIIGAINVSANANEYLIPQSDSELEDLISSFTSGSAFKSEADISTAKKTVMFSTCAYNGDDRRFIVLGSLVKIK